MKVFAMRAGEIEVRNANGERKVDVDVASSSHSVVSLLEFFECDDQEALLPQTFCEVDSSCVDVPFQKRATESKSVHAEQAQMQAQMQAQVCHDIIDQSRCIDEAAVDDDDDNDDIQSFCTCESESVRNL